MPELRKTYRGLFTPKNKNKYYGNVKNIQYRSSWELRVMHYLDENPNVLYWASEEIFVQYIHPVDHKFHRYYPDFLVRLKEKTGEIKTYILEVKPYKQTIEPSRKRQTKKLLAEVITYEINKAKWRAAETFCKQQGWTFKLVTEVDLGL